MATVTCLKCGTENPATAMNCMNCRINLQYALEHRDEMEFGREQPGFPAPVKQEALDTPEKAIDDAAARLEPMTFSGQIKGLVMLTPPDVRTTKRPHLWDARAKLRVNLRLGARQRQLHSQQWHPARGETLDLYVRQAGVNFPHACPVTLEAPTHYEVVEVPFQRYLPGKHWVSTTQEKADRISVAIGCDRYWLAIPFSPFHGPDDNAVAITPVDMTGATMATENRAVMEFRNREYARQFSELNHFKGGRWLGARHLVMRAVGYVGLILSLAWGGVELLLRLENQRPTVVAITLMGLGVLVSIYLLVKGNRGEPL